MTAERQGVRRKPRKTDNGRALRWSHRFNTWQVNSSADHQGWRNIKVGLARCYGALGWPIHTQGE